MGQSIVRYTLLRVLLFLACFAVAYLLGYGNAIGALASIVASAALSWFVLRRPRETLARDLESRIEGRIGAAPSRWDVDAAAEDAEADRSTL